MTRCKDPLGIDRWHGLGMPLSERFDTPGSEGGVYDIECMTVMTKVLSIATERQRAGFFAMVARTGATCTDLERFHAHRASRKAWKRAVVATPWWRCRLAVRRAARARWPNGEVDPKTVEGVVQTLQVLAADGIIPSIKPPGRSYAQRRRDQGLPPESWEQVKARLIARCAKWVQRGRRP